MEENKKEAEEQGKTEGPEFQGGAWKNFERKEETLEPEKPAVQGQLPPALSKGKTVASPIDTKVIRFTVVLCIVVSCVCGGGAAFFVERSNRGTESAEQNSTSSVNKMVVMDWQKIVEDRKAAFAEKYRQMDKNDPVVKEQMQKEIDEFSSALINAMSKVANGRTILAKGAVISSDAQDITDEVQQALDPSAR